MVADCGCLRTTMGGVVSVIAAVSVFSEGSSTGSPKPNTVFVGGVPMGVPGSAKKDLKWADASTHILHYMKELVDPLPETIAEAEKHFLKARLYSTDWEF